LKTYGYRVIRFTNGQVLNQLVEVITEIRAAVLERNKPLPPDVREEGVGG
jgi:very-short-patch-repair endonuclease